jgi:aspartyl-tRNA(Asn)/glutamyl-tRNA(Gln) amidotransferase subunit B
LAFERAAATGPALVEPMASYYAALAWQSLDENEPLKAAVIRVEQNDPIGVWGKEAESTRDTRSAGEPVVHGEIGADTGLLERERVRADSPALAAALARYREELGLPDDLADLLTGRPADSEFFDQALAALTDATRAQSLANWLVHEVRGASADGSAGRLEPTTLASLVDLVEDNEVSRKVAKELLGRLIESGGEPREIVEREGLGRIGDADAIGGLIDQVLEKHPEELERFRGGQTGLEGFFVGQIMRASGGRADPALVRQALGDRLRDGSD